MTLAPYLLALTFGLLISALLHFVLVWPAREPAEEMPADADAPVAPAPRRRTPRRRR